MSAVAVVGFVAAVVSVGATGSPAIVSTVAKEGVSSLSYAPKPFYDDLSRMRVRLKTTGRARRGYHYVVLLTIRGPDALNHPTGDPGCAYGAGSTVKGSYVPHDRVLGAPGKTYTIWLKAYEDLGGELLAEEHIVGRYSVDPNLFRPRADYLLKVRGMSMRDAGILDGDLLAVHKTVDARSGQIVVARLQDEVTVKRLRRRGATVELLPENPDFKPIVIDSRETPLAIEGIAVGVIRNTKL